MRRDSVMVSASGALRPRLDQFQPIAFGVAHHQYLIALSAGAHLAVGIAQLRQPFRQRRVGRLQIVEIVTEAPGHEPVTSRHLLLDRIPPAAREAGSVTAEELAPVAGDVSLPAQLSSAQHVLVSTGGASPRASAVQRAWAAYYAATAGTDPEMVNAGVDVAFWPAAIADQVLVTTSEFDILPGVNDESVRAYVAQPRVYVTSAGLDGADPNHISLSTDLLIDDVRMLAADPTATGAVAEHQQWYGTLQAALETEQALRSAAAIDPESRVVDGVSLAMTQPLTVLTPDTLGSLPATAAPCMAAICAA